MFTNLPAVPPSTATLARNKEFAAFKRSFIYLSATQTVVFFCAVCHGMVEEVLALFQRVCGAFFLMLQTWFYDRYCWNMGHVLGYVVLGMTATRGKNNEVQ